MRRLLVATAVIVFSLTAPAQTSAPNQTPSPAQSQTGEHPSTVCVVSGRVVAAAQGSPLKSARVALIPEHSHAHQEIYGATTDPDGQFVLKDLPPGRYRFLAMHNGFVDEEYTGKSADAPVILSLSAGQKVSDVLFRLTIAAAITGRVTNDDGEAMVRLQVVALRQPSEDDIEDEDPFSRRTQKLRTAASAHTDDRGLYRIFGLEPGDYYIRVTDSQVPELNTPVGDSFWLQQELGSEYAPVYYPGVPQVHQAQIVSVKAGEETQADVLIRHVKTVDVAGHVVGPKGVTADASVSLDPADAEAYVSSDRHATTDDKGSFRFRNIPEGSYWINVYSPGEKDFVYENRARQKIEVGSENIDSLAISLTGGSTIPGRIIVNGINITDINRATVALSPVEGDEQLGGMGRVAKDGTFEIPSVHDGSYAVHVWMPGEGHYTKSIRYGADDVLEKGLQVEGGGTGGKLEIVMGSDCAQLEGVVTNADGPVIGARVRIVPDAETPYNGFRRRSTTTDQVGKFSLIGLAPGKYRVMARSKLPSQKSSIKSEPQTVTLAADDHQTVQLTLAKPQQ
ncbi:MAG: carboxypeptidase regulatory-like domain-containing protein [Candidatus Sulfotelmatobacter sp.]